MKSANSDNQQYIIPGSIDAVVFGMVVATAGYLLKHHVWPSIGEIVGIAGILIALSGVGKVVYDMVTGFPNQRRLLK